MIMNTANTGGIKIHRQFHPDRPPTWNMRYRLYTGINIPRPGNPAFLNTLHREIIISANIAANTIIRIIASHPKTAHIIAVIPFMASGLMLPVNTAHESSKEKFIIFFKQIKIDTDKNSQLTSKFKH
jgi:hypothetical protein